MTARNTLRALFLLLMVVCCTPAFGQYYPQQPTQQSPTAGPPRPNYQVAQAVPQSATPAPGAYQPAPPQPYSQAAGPPRPAYPPSQPVGQSAAPSQGAYQGAPSQPAPQGASAVVPQNAPTLERRAPQLVTTVFPQLTPDEQARVDDVLNRWEQASRKHQRITIEFFRFEFKPVFTNMQNVPYHIDQGEADFDSSGKWLWKIKGEIVKGKLVEGQRAEQMLFDGTSIYEFNYPGQVVTQYVLDDDMKGEDMVRAMLPFLFGTDVQKLKERYFIRLLDVPNLAKDEVCIDASPRFIDEARNYINARMILDMAKMKPTGLMLTLPTGNESYRYQFADVKINPMNPLDLIQRPRPFAFKLPSGWATEVKKMSAAEVTSHPQPNATR